MNNHVPLLSQSMIIVLLLSLSIPLEASSAQANDLSIACYALSRGRGVPEATREAFKEIHFRFNTLKEQGKVVTVKNKRIGLEGEHKICAEFVDETDAQRVWDELQEMTKDLDLANIKKEGCD